MLATAGEWVIDGVDQLDFFLGADHSNREGFPIYNGDEMFAYKWRDWKIHFIELAIFNTDQTAAWMLPAIFEEIATFRRSLAREPPIPLGTPDPYEPAGR